MVRFHSWREFLALLIVTVPLAAFAADGPADAVAAIVAALETKASLSLSDVPLHQAAREIGAAHKINVVLDEKALGDAGVAPDTVASAKIESVLLRTALGVLLDPLDLTYIIRNDVLLITTHDVASNDTSARVYNVADLLTAGAHGTQACKIDELSELMMTVVAPNTWDEVGGPGSIPAYDDCLVVSQTWAVHRQIEGLLSALRQVQKSPKVLHRVWALNPMELAALDQIEGVLSTPEDLVVTKKPLSQFVDQLAKEKQLPVRLDVKAMSDAGVSPDYEVSVNVHQIKLSAALDLMLHQSALTADPRGEILWITTPDVASNQVHAAVYDVRDVMDEEKPNYESLVSALTATVLPNTWDEVGGPASVIELPALRCLVVSQTHHGHERVAEFLSSLRIARAESHPNKVNKTASN